MNIEEDEMTRFESAAEFDPRLKLDCDTVFLLVLVKGRINLFFLSDEQNKQHYFIQKGIGRIEELIYRKVLIKEPTPTGAMNANGVVTAVISPYQMVVFEDFKKQLMKAMMDCTAVEQEINRLLYANSIVNVVKKYNACVGELTYTKPKDRAKHTFYVCTG